MFTRGNPSPSLPLKALASIIRGPVSPRGLSAACKNKLARPSVAHRGSSIGSADPS